MQTRLAALKLTFQWHNGIDGRSLSPDLLARLSTGSQATYKRPLTSSEIGCYLSHLALWIEIAAGPDPVVVVLEDDAVLAASAKTDLAWLSSQSPDWDLLKICYEEAPAPPADAPVRCVRSTRLPPATIGYAITRPAAARMAQYAWPLRRPVDLDLRFWWEHGLCVKVTDRPLGGADPRHRETSAIAPERHRTRTTGVMRGLFANLRYQASRRLSEARARRYMAEPLAPTTDDTGACHITLPPTLAEALSQSGPR